MVHGCCLVGDWGTRGGDKREAKAPKMQHIAVFSAMCKGYGINARFKLWRYFFVSLRVRRHSGIQQIVAFIALCEGYLGIYPHFELWRYFFLSLCRYAAVHLRRSRAMKYMQIEPRWNTKWHCHWFYMKNDPVAPFPAFSGCLVEVAPDWWHWGPLQRRRSGLPISRTSLCSWRVEDSAELGSLGLIT